MHLFDAVEHGTAPSFFLHIGEPVARSETQVTVQEIADWVGGKVEGDPSLWISGVAPLEAATPGQLSFLAFRKYQKLLDRTGASALLVGKECPTSSKTLIRVENPLYAFLQVVERFFPPVRRQPKPGVHPTALVDPQARLGEGVSVGPFVVIEPRVRIGDRTTVMAGCYVGEGACIGSDALLHANVTVGHECLLGDRVVVHSGAVIGSDGFGFVKEKGAYHKIPHLGSVVIEDDVEIGANCTIDRATFGETRIGKGVKLDNLIHVAHNVVIGEHTVIAAQTGISGSTEIGRRVTIGGQVGFVGHIQIGDESTFGAQAGVTKSIPPRTVVSGYPAKPHHQARREEAALRQLPELIKRVRALEKKLKNGG
jgi:UDP-3-O-[3-hydroxymyristoyl] glucosamine N-acyltransferase